MKDKKEKRTSNFMLALRSIKCDFISTFKSWYVIIFLYIMAIALIPTDGEEDKGFLIFCLLYLLELYLSNFMPQCKRIYYILPFTTQDRIAIMKWRVHIVEAAMVLYTALGFTIQRLVYSSSDSLLQFCVSAFLLLGYEALAAMQYAGYRKEKKMVQSALGLIVGGAAFIVSIIVFVFELRGIPWMVISVVVMIGVRWYFSTKADFTEYQYVTVIQLSAREEVRRKAEG